MSMPYVDDVVVNICMNSKQPITHPSGAFLIEKSPGVQQCVMVLWHIVDQT